MRYEMRVEERKRGEERREQGLTEGGVALRVQIKGKIKKENKG